MAVRKGSVHGTRGGAAGRTQAELFARPRQAPLEQRHHVRLEGACLGRLDDHIGRELHSLQGATLHRCLCRRGLLPRFACAELRCDEPLAESLELVGGGFNRMRLVHGCCSRSLLGACAVGLDAAVGTADGEEARLGGELRRHGQKVNQARLECERPLDGEKVLERGVPLYLGHVRHGVVCEKFRSHGERGTVVLEVRAERTHRLRECGRVWPRVGRVNGIDGKKDVQVELNLLGRRVRAAHEWRHKVVPQRDYFVTPPRVQCL
mmetsp:Transcript_40229/g.119464  ORF Transcript_40229/g.119464 Transcript_40229/m.119464 type:complete len:264 (-) Transcript_40229:289-1080(-)